MNSSAQISSHPTANAAARHWAESDAQSCEAPVLVDRAHRVIDLTARFWGLRPQALS
jgi:hypothetical protein